LPFSLRSPIYKSPQLNPNKHGIKWLKQKIEAVMKMKDYIEINPEVMLGKPVVKGTRIPVELIIRKMGEGSTIEAILDGYPNLSREAVLAALIYAADTIGNEKIIELRTGT
jgi:uncharacterized protein (DUF433 family)